MNWNEITPKPGRLRNLGMKKRSERRKHCALTVVIIKAEPKISARRRPPSRGRRNLISWRWSLPSPTNPVWWRSMHAISSYRGNRPTNKHTNPQTNIQTGPITTHCAAMLSAQCNYRFQASHFSVTDPAISYASQDSVSANWLLFITVTCCDVRYMRIDVFVMAKRMANKPSSSEKVNEYLVLFMPL